MNKMYLFLENFYTLLDAGYSVDESLTLCDDIIHLDFINDIQEQLHQGDDIYHVLMDPRFPKLFREYFSFYKNKNCLSEAIEKSLKICQTQKDLYSKLKSKLSYPLILIVFLLCFSLFVVFILLPQVNQLFDSFGLDKSLLIQVVFTMFYIFPAIFIVLSTVLIYCMIQLFIGLKKKNHKVIERYLKIPIISSLLQKYFSLKFAVYYNELSVEGTDSASIIQIMNQQMVDSDIKIVLYEMKNRVDEGESIEDLLLDFEYFDPLFLTFFNMFLQNPKERSSIEHYIQMTYQQLDYTLSKFIQYLIPAIYSFVAVFVITIYISIVIPMMNIISDI